MAAAFLVEKNANYFDDKTRENFCTCFSRQWETLVSKLWKQRNEIAQEKRKSEKREPSAMTYMIFYITEISAVDPTVSENLAADIFSLIVGMLSNIQKKYNAST